MSKNVYTGLFLQVTVKHFFAIIDTLKKHMQFCSAIM